MPPTVTAIVPTYNRPALLAESIESALAQTYEDLLVLVGDNGGSPFTEGVVRGFADPRVKYVRHPEGLGAEGNWLKLIEMAETPLVASLHDDDTWAPTFLEKTVPTMLEDPTISMVFTDYWCVDDDGDRLLEYTDWLTAHSGRDHLAPGRFAGSYQDGLRMVAVRGAAQSAYAAVLRRQAVLDTEFPTEISPIYDLWLAYRIFARGEGLAYVPERLTSYRVWGGSLTALGYGPGLNAVFAHVVAENLTQTPVIDEIQREWAQHRFSSARNCFDDPDQRGMSRREFREASPFLSGSQWLMAEVAGRSDFGWEALRRLRAGVRAVRARSGSLTAGNGVREDLIKASSSANGITP